MRSNDVPGDTSMGSPESTFNENVMTSLSAAVSPGGAVGVAMRGLRKGVRGSDVNHLPSSAAQPSMTKIAGERAVTTSTLRETPAGESRNLRPTTVPGFYMS